MRCEDALLPVREGFGSVHQKSDSLLKQDLAETDHQALFGVTRSFVL